MSSLAYQELTESTQVILFKDISRIYTYYEKNGLLPIVMERVSSMIIHFICLFCLCILICFFDFLSPQRIIVDFGNLIKNPDPVRLYVGLTITCLYSLFWVLNCLRFFYDLPSLFRIRQIYLDHNIHILNNFVDFEDILTILKLDRESSIAEIMRKDNFLIRIFNSDVLPISSYSYPLELMLDICLWEPILSSFPRISKRGDVEENIGGIKDMSFSADYVGYLQKRLKIYGVIFLLCSPIICFYFLFYYFIGYFNILKQTPAYLCSRQWTRLAYWKYRKINELSYVYNRRLYSDELQKDLNNFFSFFPSTMGLCLYYVINVLTFILSIITVFLLVLVFFETPGEADGYTLVIFSRSIVWYLGVFGFTLALLYSLSESLSKIQTLFLTGEIQEEKRKIQIHLGICLENKKKDDFLEKLSGEYDYRFKFFLRNLFDIFVGPYLLFFVLPTAMENLIHFVNSPKNEESFPQNHLNFRGSPISDPSVSSIP
jgi:hypothetical protein